MLKKFDKSSKILYNETDERRGAAMTIKTRMTALLILLSILLSTSVVFAENGRVKCDLLNVRVSPNTQCEIIDRLPFGESFEIIYTENGWYNIKMKNGITGFVNAEYVTNSTDVKAEGDAGEIISNAHNFIGYPYSYGSSGPNAFDCSGFTTYLFKQQGYYIWYKIR